MTARPPAEGATVPPPALLEHFATHFGAAAEVLVRAPGRVNLIGEHTDYNDGFVLPIALDRAVWIALRPRGDDTVSAYSLNFQERASFSLSDLRPGGPAWAEYLKGTAWALGAAGYALRGWDGVVFGDVPVGAGLSSSAAMELAAARAFVAVSGAPWDPALVARLCQRAENEWVGVQCGIMDQMISAVGRAGHAVLIDCRTLDTRAAPLPRGTAVAVLDTGTRRRLAGSEYNARRAECERAAARLGVAALRDVSPAALDAARGSLDATELRRARHVVTENQRVLDAVEAMIHDAAATLGRLMNESHASLRDDFEVSGVALDQMVAAAQRHPACYGARMTGGGFAGCAVALVQRAGVEDFLRRVADEYHQQSGQAGELFVCEPSDGASAHPVAPPGGAPRL